MTPETGAYAVCIFNELTETKKSSASPGITSVMLVFSTECNLIANFLNIDLRKTFNLYIMHVFRRCCIY